MVLTFQDGVERLIDYLGGQVSDVVLRDCKKACIDALQEIAHAHTWTYLYKHGRLATSASFTGGMIAYRASGGTYPYQVSLVGGVWPSWAALGVIRVADLNYDVDLRKSDTVVTLKPPQVPPADFTLQPFGLFQSAYQLPADWIAQDVSFIPNNFGGWQYVHPREYLLQTACWGIWGNPIVYTIMADPDLNGRLAIWVAPFPTVAQSVEFLYKRRPVPLMVFKESAGTVSAAQDTNIFSGSGTNFTSLMSGDAVLRVSSIPKQLPTAEFGPNPAVFESKVTSVDPVAQTLTTWDAIPASVADASFVISTWIDITTGAMQQAYQRCTEKYIGMSRVLKDKPSARTQYLEALEVAKCADSRNVMPRVAGPPVPIRYRLKDYPANLGREL